MNRHFTNFHLAILAILAIGAVFSLSGCMLLQSTVVNTTSGYWGRTADDNYDPTKIAPVYCYASLSQPECYDAPLPPGTKRRLIGEQHPYKNAKQIAAEKENNFQPGQSNIGTTPPVNQSVAPVPQYDNAPITQAPNTQVPIQVQQSYINPADYAAPADAKIAPTAAVTAPAKKPATPAKTMTPKKKTPPAANDAALVVPSGS